MIYLHPLRSIIHHVICNDSYNTKIIQHEVNFDTETPCKISSEILYHILIIPMIMKAFLSPTLSHNALMAQAWNAERAIILGNSYCILTYIVDTYDSV